MTELSLLSKGGSCTRFTQPLSTSSKQARGKATLLPAWHVFKSAALCPCCAEIGSLESALQTELRLCRALPGKDVAAVPTVASVLQAFAVLGQLRSKFKHYGECSFVHRSLTVLASAVVADSVRLLLPKQAFLNAWTTLCLAIHTPLCPVSRVGGRYFLGSRDDPESPTRASHCPGVSPLVSSL